MAGTSPRLFIGGLKRNVEKEELMEEFKEFGEIVDMWIAYDPPGFAFLEFSTPESAKNALETKHKTTCFECEIRVEYTKKKDDLKKEENSANAKPRLFIGNIVDTVEKEDVRSVYEKFGNVTDVWIAHNPPGFAFVEFETEDMANKAVEETNGTELFGGEVKVQITKGRREGRRNRVNEMRDRRAPRGGGFPSNNSTPPPRRAPYPPVDPYGRRRAPPPARDPYARDPYARDPYYASPYARDPYYAREAPPAPAPAPAPAPYYPPADPYARDPYYARDYPPPAPVRPRRPVQPEPYPPSDPYSGATFY